MIVGLLGVAMAADIGVRVEWNGRHAMAYVVPQRGLHFAEPASIELHANLSQGGGLDRVWVEPDEGARRGFPLPDVRGRRLGVSRPPSARRSAPSCFRRATQRVPPPTLRPRPC